MSFFNSRWQVCYSWLQILSFLSILSSNTHTVQSSNSHLLPLQRNTSNRGEESHHIPPNSMGEHFRAKRVFSHVRDLLSFSSSSKALDIFIANTKMPALKMYQEIVMTLFLASCPFCFSGYFTTKAIYNCLLQFFCTRDGWSFLDYSLLLI